jgi:hypothetical protein
MNYAPGLRSLTKFSRRNAARDDTSHKCDQVLLDVVSQLTSRYGELLSHQVIHNVGIASDHGSIRTLAKCDKPRGQARFFGLAKLKQETSPANISLSKLPTANDAENHDSCRAPS